MPSDDRVLVIGGTGFIGRILVRQLSNAGCHVRILTRRSGFQNTDSVEYVRGEVADWGSLMRAVEGISVVYDLSMGGGTTWADYERDFIGGAENVAEACLAHKVRRLIYTSSTAALYLGAAGNMDESAGTDPKPHLRGMYARGKILAERSLLKLYRSRGLPVVIVRPALVVGSGGKLAPPGAGFWVSPTCVVGPGKGRNPLPFVLVDDVARAMFLAKDAPQIEGMIFNLAGDVRPTAIDYLDWVGERSLRNFRFYPKSLLRSQSFHVFVWLVKKALRKPDNPWPSYHELKSGTKRTQLDCSAAKNYLGWRPTSNREDFVRLAIDYHLKPVKAGDLRLL